MRGGFLAPPVTYHEKYLADTTQRVSHGAALTFSEFLAWQNLSKLEFLFSEIELIVELSIVFSNAKQLYAIDKKALSPMDLSNPVIRKKREQLAEDSWMA